MSDSMSQRSLAQPAGDKADEKAKDSDGKAAVKIGSNKFNHKTHAKYEYPDSQKKAVTDENCSDCHGSDPKGKLATPAKSGHQPCLSAGCHVKWFMSATLDTKGRDPVLYKKAVSFCLGCHENAASEAPKRHTKAAADAVYKNNTNPGYHVELNHFAHTERTGCRDCHVVEKRTYKLKLDTPGHAECAACHGVEDDAEPMSQCAECHESPGPKEYFHNEWKGSETRSCGSPSHLALAKKQKKSPEKVPCFKHERREHRFRKGDKRLECGHCHFMIDNRRLWKSNRYESIRDIRAAPIIHNNRDLAHETCGESRACHKRDVDDSRGSADCKLCHSQKTIDNDLFSP